MKQKWLGLRTWTVILFICVGATVVLLTVFVSGSDSGINSNCKGVKQLRNGVIHLLRDFKRVDGGSQIDATFDANIRYFMRIKCNGL